MNKWHGAMMAALSDLHGWQRHDATPFDASLRGLVSDDQPLFENLLALARHLPPGHTLDVGGGKGIGAAILRLLGHEVVLLDAAPYCHGQAEIAQEWGFEVVQGDAEDLPFADGHFDNVLCHHTLEHVPAPLYALAECNRVTRPGGLLAVGVPPCSHVETCASHIHNYNAALLVYLVAIAGYRVTATDTRTYDLQLWAEQVGPPFGAGMDTKRLQGRCPEGFSVSAARVLSVDRDGGGP